MNLLTWGDVDVDELLVDVADLPAPVWHRLVLPANWSHLDLRPGRSARSIRRLVDERTRRFPDTAGYRRELLTCLRALVNDGVLHHALRLAVLAEPVAPGQVLAASFTVMPGAGAPDGDGATNHPAAVAGHLAATAADGDGTLLAAPDLLIDLAALPQQVAVRSAGTLRQRDPRSGHVVESYQVQYSVPMPGTSELLLLTFCTLCGWAADELTVLFDMIAQTFYWEWEEPT